MFRWATVVSNDLSVALIHIAESLTAIDRAEERLIEASDRAALDAAREGMHAARDQLVRLRDRRRADVQ